MSKISKIIALTALIIFAFSMTAIGNVLAGEKVKCRNVWYLTKWQQVEVGDEEGHVVAVLEKKSVQTNLEGKAFGDGWPIHQAGFVDMNLKTGVGVCHGYNLWTDKDGDKIYERWEGRNDGKGWKGTFILLKGTGKYEGIKGKATWVCYDVAPFQAYCDWEGEVELP